MRPSDLERLAATLGGLAIWGCLPKGPAARAGVRYGDILLSANGEKTPTVDAYAAALHKAKSTLTLVVFREGVELTLTVRLPRRRAKPAEVADAARQVVERRMMPLKRSKKNGGAPS